MVAVLFGAGDCVLGSGVFAGGEEREGDCKSKGGHDNSVPAKHLLQAERVVEED